MQKMEMLAHCQRQSWQLKNYLIRPRDCLSKRNNENKDTTLERMGEFLCELKNYKESLPRRAIDHTIAREEKIR